MPVHTILVVDDDADFRRLLGLHLTKRGYRVIFAHNGLEAAAQAESQQPDLIILDFQMPAADGATAHKWLGSSATTKSTPVIFLSGLPVEQVKRAVPERPHTRFMSKPVDHPKLLAHIHALIQAKEEPASGRTVLDLDHPEPPAA